MPHMTAFLGGDSSILASRSAKTGDVKLAIDFPDERSSLLFILSQDGEIFLSWMPDGLNENSEVENLHLIGMLVKQSNGKRTLLLDPEPTDLISEVLDANDD